MLMKEWSKLEATLNCSAEASAIAKQSPNHSYDTLMMVFQQLYRRQIAKSFYLVREHGQGFVDRFKAGQSLIDISEWINLSPTVVARRVLELHLNLNRKQITNALREPGKIKDKRLRSEVQMCVDCDEYSGPRMDRIRTVLGLEYELRLLEELRNLRVQFESEDDLRKRGCHKTPDVLLHVPIAFCGKVVCWIDSKAKFGDKFTLNKDYSDSIASYAGRFGPGMVIYWFGFIEDCPSAMMEDSAVLVVDTFPDDIEMLPGTTLPYLEEKSFSLR